MDVSDIWYFKKIISDFYQGGPSRLPNPKHVYSRKSFEIVNGPGTSAFSRLPDHLEADSLLDRFRLLSHFSQHLVWIGTSTGLISDGQRIGESS